MTLKSENFKTHDKLGESDMSVKKDILFGDDSRAKILVGAKKLAAAVKVTLGPRGRNVIMQRSDLESVISKDGVTVAKSIVLKDPQENVGAQMVKNVAGKTADVAGDGTTTSAVLAEAILDQGMKLIAANHDPMSIKRGIDKAVSVVVDSLRESSRPVKSSDDIKKVATISANGETDIGIMIAKAMEEVGNDGVITLEEGKGFESKLHTSQGFEWDRGYLSAYFMTPEEVNAGRKRCVYENARIWLIDGKLSTTQDMEDMLPTLEACMSQSIPVVIVAEDISGAVLNTLAMNAAQGRLQCVAVKSPGYGASRKEMVEDLSVITGATVKDPAVSDSVLKDVSIEDLGLIRRIEVSKDKTVVIGMDGQEDAIKTQCDSIRASLKDVDSEWNREQMEKRLAKLTGGVATIEVGAPTEVAMREKRDRIEDALAATRAAVAEGVVAGGGVALVRAGKALKAFETGNVEEDFGVNIIKSALQAPMMQIIKNAGESEQVVVNEVLAQENNEMGWNAATRKYVNMFQAGIIDPTKVARVALQNAADIAGLMLTTECLISIEDTAEPAQTGPGMMM